MLGIKWANASAIWSVSMMGGRTPRRLAAMMTAFSVKSSPDTYAAPISRDGQPTRTLRDRQRVEPASLAGADGTPRLTCKGGH